MLKLFTGRNLYSLADALLDDKKASLAQNILAPEFFVVQNYGMARWLSLYIAEKEGVAANLEFKFPAEIFWQIVRVMDPSIPQALPSERDPMTWALMSILQSDNDSSLQQLHHYVGDDDPVKQDVRRWQLAKRIADVFDQYLTYRPDMLLSWEKMDYHHLQNLAGTERWQAVLWRKLRAYWHQQPTKEWSHRAALQRQLLETIKNNTLDPEPLPQQITVFGVSSMPPVYINMLVALSSTTDVAFYTMAGETASDHQLTQSMGMAGTEFRTLLEAYTEEVDGVNAEHVSTSSGNESNNGSLHQVIKSDLLGTGNFSGEAISDDSIQIHSCHNTRREVEVLHDQLLAMLDNDKTLNPSDILVMAPDIESYVAEVNAIFGTDKMDSVSIPYHFSERSGRYNGVEEGFKKVLELAESRFNVTDIIDILSFSPIKLKLALTDKNIHTLERWVAENNIHWGINSEHKDKLNQPESNSFTWQSGLNRMLLGYAMNPQGDELYNNIFPSKEIDRSEDAALAGRFAKFMHTLFELHHKAQEPRTLTEWSTVLSEMLSSLMHNEEPFIRDIQRIRDIIFSLQEQSSLSGFGGTVPYRVVYSWLSEKLELSGAGGGRSGKGVTFSSMIPMRNIPSRVICLLGMDDDAFPSQHTPMTFDLIQQDPKPGDRIHRRDDRQLFLETLLAAGERFYVSYVGKSDRQDSDFPPSVVLREWMDYVIDRYKIDEDDLVNEHRLQAFSPAYFTSESTPKLFSYSQTNAAIARQLTHDESEQFVFLEGEIAEPDSSYQKLTLNELISFYQHPAKFLLQNRFSIYLHEENIIDEDRESFMMGGLQRYSLGQELLDRYLENKETASYKNVAAARGMLPDGWPGEYGFDRKEDEVQAFGSHLKDIFRQKAIEPIEVDLSIGDFTITGRLDSVFENEQALFRFGKMRPKELIEWWISHLIFQMVKPDDHSGISRLYTTDKNQPVATHQLAPIEKPVPIIAGLLKTYWAGLQKNIFFYPETSFAYAEEIIENEKEEESGLKKASYKWKNRHVSYDLEGDDQYNRCLLKNANPLANNIIAENFKQNSIHFWKPFFERYDKKTGKR